MKENRRKNFRLTTDSIRCPTSPSFVRIKIFSNGKYNTLRMCVYVCCYVKGHTIFSEPSRA